MCCPAAQASTFRRTAARSSSPTFFPSPVTARSARRITNAGYFKLSGTLGIGDATEQFGRFILSSNATIDLSGTAKLSFANSGAETWNNAAILVVSNWNGSPTGGGAEQLKFGAN